LRIKQTIIEIIEQMCYNIPISNKEVFSMSNLEIRKQAKENGVRLWEVVDALGIADTTFCRRLRRELPTEEKERVISIIRELSRKVG